MAVEVDMFHNYITHSIRRTGHARFRRGPADQSTTTTTTTCTSSHSHDQPDQSNFEFKLNFETEAKTEEFQSANSSEMLAIAGEEATVSDGKLGLLITGVATSYSSKKPPLPLSHFKKWRENKQCVRTDSPSNQVIRSYSSAKPPLPSSHWKRRHEIEQVSGDRLSLHGCHCCKRRKKIEITGRIKISKGLSLSIPSDEYSWKKYNHKLIMGSSSSRGGYYKCNSVKECSARKHVIKDKNDPTVLMVTYKGEHNHCLPEILTNLNCSDLNRILVKSG